MGRTERKDMNLRVGLIAIALFGMSVALVGCPNVSDVPDGVTTPDDGESTDSSGGGGTTDDTGGAGAETDGSAGTTDEAGGGGETDGSSGGDAVSDGAGDAADADSGGDTGTTPDNGGQTTLTGTYSGEIACTQSESLQGAPGPERQTTRTFSVTFGGNGLATGFIVPGYSHGLEFFAAVSQAGGTVTLNESSGNYQATLIVTVASATYTATGGRVILSLDYEGQEVNLTEEGTGVQTVEFELGGSALTYSSLTSYEVDMMAGTLTLPTTKEYDCQGTLSPE
jgi:hypothetical protein